MVGPPQLFGPISPIGYVHRDRGTLLGHYLDPTRSSNYLGHCMPTVPFMIANTIMGVDCGPPGSPRLCCCCRGFSANSASDVAYISIHLHDGPIAGASLPHRVAADCFQSTVQRCRVQNPRAHALP
jgi:hypothetical protein